MKTPVDYVAFLICLLYICHDDTIFGVIRFEKVYLTIQIIQNLGMTNY